MRSILLAFPALLLLSAALPSAKGQTQCTRFQHASQVTTSTKKAEDDASAMIEKLVNLNPAPELVGDGSDTVPIFDKKYDWAEYHRVWKVLRELATDAEVLWPELVKHLDDDRYCMTGVTFSDSTFNWTVGDACQERMAHG